MSEPTQPICYPDQVVDYQWIVIVGGIASFVMSYGIGANDVANAFATSVGSKTLKLWQAVMVAAVFEFTGSLMGGTVTSTIKSGIVETDLYANEPAVFMLGMLCALIGAGTWVLTATRLGLPVSTTHSIVGAIMGFSIVAQGWNSIQWFEVGMIALSWIISPVLAGVVSATVFFLVRRFILRQSDSLRRGFIFYPFLIFITVAVNIFYMTFKGLKAYVDIPWWQGLLIALGGGVAIAVMIQFTFVPWLRRRVETVAWGDYGVVEPLLDENSPLTKEQAVEAPAKADVAFTSENATAIDVTGSNYEGKASTAKPKKEDSMFSAHWNRMIGNDLEETAFQNDSVKDMHSAAEKFDGKTEHIFSYLQVVTACFMSFAHGANDVSNSIGPFAAIYDTYHTGCVSGDSPVEIWILVMGGAGIVIGLLTYGYNVIRAIGLELIKITPARGFCIELSSATTVIAATMLGLPISSTHCQVGSTVAVGMLEGKSGFNWWLFTKTFASWIFTIIFAAGVSGGIFAFSHYAP